ncbi:ATP-binding cassette domain-containing protein [Cereibacter sp. SYSU M97828]|nr:ATP-binding cassette domain-containing protein [Cereibacter flavus]
MLEACGIGLTIAKGEIVGLTGPTGVGKTTLGRALAGLPSRWPGAVALDGGPVALGAVQYLHQHPILAMNPRWHLRRIVEEAGPHDPDLAARLGIAPAVLDRFPHEASGGQLQRISVLRGLAARPRFLIADEITAPLDAITQARIWKALAARPGIGILAISHDRALLDRIAVRTVVLKPQPIVAAGRARY